MSKLEQAINAAGGPIRISGDAFEKEYAFTADFIGFDGHFPDRPILPAVVQLMTGANAVTEAAGRPMTVNAVSRAKFLKQLCPGDILTITGSLSPKGDALLAPIKILSGDDTASTFTLTLIEDKS